MPNSSLSAEEIRRRARWYVGVRWLYVLGVGVPGIIVLYLNFGFGLQVKQDIWLLSNVLIINALFLLSTYIRITSRLAGRILAGAQIGFDLLLMSMAFYLNGGGETPLASFYAIPIVMTAAFFGRRAIYTVGVTVATIYTALSLLDYNGIVRPLNVAAPQLHTLPQLFYPPLVAVVAIFLSITVITDLVGKLIREREQLAEDMRALSRRNAETEAILRTMGSALVTVGPDGKIMLVNDSFERLTGWRRHEITGRPLDEVLPILDDHGHRIPAAHRPMLQFITDNQRSKTLSVRALNSYSYLRKDGTTFPFEGSVAPILSGSKVVGFTTVFEDATESKKIEHLKDNFIALVSHQLKTPIGEINGYAYNLLGGIGGQLNAKQTDYVTHIQELAARSGKLIVDLLDIVIAGRGNLAVVNTPIDLAPVVAQVAKLHQARIDKKGLKLEVRMPHDLVYVRGDEHKLTQAIGNIVDNAISASKKGSISVSVVPADKVVNIYISDEGGGMDQATIDALFGETSPDGPLGHAPTAEGGTGLGFYLAKQLIALMNGTVQMTASTKRGTTICVTLNRVKP